MNYKKKKTYIEKITIENGKKTIERITEEIEIRPILIVGIIGSIGLALKYYFFN